MNWKHTTNIYEVNIRQYTIEGTFKAFQAHLPRLKKMGIETIWLMPITPIAEKNKKGTLGSPYACKDYKSINPEFGTLEDFKNLVNEIHQLDLKIIIDWVANHTGWDHIWTKTHPEYYKIDPKTKDFQIASGMDDIIELDFNNSALRNSMIKAMKFWVKEFNIDGFRCDLATWVKVDFWQEARPKLEEIKPLFFIGEYDELENPEYGNVFDASYSWKWMHKTEDYCKQNLALQDLRHLLIQYSAIGDQSMRAWFTSNHDENSWNGTEYEKYGEIALPLAVFSATWNGIPLLYSGQELPNNKRLEFFEKNAIEWKASFKLENFYTILFNLKSKNTALKGGDQETKTYFVSTSADDKILAYLRKNGNDEVLVLLNFSKEEVDFRINDEMVSGKFTEIFSKSKIDSDKEKDFNLKIGGYLVFEKEQSI
ncbi:alpha-amylase family glycosyl hydrolase [Frigoriflavimonas asaccharolytica]|uniref:Glycosidase n=1 Tax=Frigoriflavimonas asaccharolytica TaxID=2735899 RepID=A0A8J8G9E6_9FLAO|nr:alpha-amylase family glycosyl hydrolase [Frigoriflavimonas asaccharolytica]NRS93095.1 glycosidase [Frigoriflavimonas asaccharolytica]